VATAGGAIGRVQRIQADSGLCVRGIAQITGSAGGAVRRAVQPTASPAETHGYHGVVRTDAAATGNLAETSGAADQRYPKSLPRDGTTIVAGRAFSEDDNESSPGVAIVNRAFARQFYPGDALGKRFHSM